MKRIGDRPLTHTEKCRRVRANRRKKGQCWYCTEPIAPGSRGLCVGHRDRAKIRHRRTPETGKWQPGSVGRIPLWAKEAGLVPPHPSRITGHAPSSTEAA